MAYTKLKNYKIYLKKLEDFCEMSNIKIYWREVEGEGQYDHNYHKLLIDKDLDEADEIATILHELGHAYDANFSNKKVSPKIWKSYEKVYSKTHGKKELDTVVEAEVRAWDNGKLIARHLKIPLGSWYARFRKSCLLNYRNT